MDLSLLIKGITAGLIVAIPIGPVGTICTQRLLTNGYKSGIISGIGAATADAFFASLASFGLFYISQIFIRNQIFFRFFIGFFLIYLGLKVFLNDKKITKQKNNEGYIMDYLSTLFITIGNPFLILVFANIFAKMHIKYLPREDIYLLVVGVFFGSLLWWIALSLIMYLFNVKLTNKRIVLVNKLFGLLILIFGFAFLLFKKLSIIKF